MAVIQNQKPVPTTDVDGKPLQTIGTAAPSGQSSSTGAPASPTTQPQGSGRFTNIQKYINANKSGGQKIAGQIGSTLQNQFGQQSKEAQDYTTKLQQGIQQGNQVAQTGQGYTQQLKDIGTQIGSATTAGFEQRGQQDQGLAGIEQFANQPGFNQFQNIQAGRGINEQALSLNQQRAAQAAQAATQGTQQAQQALSTEGGRFDLLQKQFGGNTGPGYSQGQQRLDQVLLGQGGGLNALQAKTIAQNRINQQLAKTAAGGAADVTRLANQEQGLIGDINTQAGANEQAYMKMLQGYIDPTNQQRAAEVADLNAAIGSFNKPYLPGDEGQRQSGFTAEQTARLGLGDANTGVYNVFRGQQGVGGVENANQIASLGAQAQNVQDVANQADVNRYKALSKIIGSEFVPQITKASDLGASYTANTGDTGLKERLAAAQNAFNTESGKQISYSPFGSDSVYSTGGDLIKKGREGLIFHDKYDYNAYPDRPISQTDQADYYTRNFAPGVINQFQNLLNQQNYNQTLGGQRNTFLDTEANAINPPKSNIPITGEDPSLNYLKDLIKPPTTDLVKKL